MTFLSQIKNNTVTFITNHPVLTAAVTGYGLTHAYSVLNPVGGAILFATFVYNDGLKPQEKPCYVLIGYKFKDASKARSELKTLKACVIAWSAAYYVTPYVNLATGAKVFSAVVSVPGKLGALISAVVSVTGKLGAIILTVASKAFACLLAMPSQMYTSTAFAVNLINFPALATTVAVVVVVVSLYKFWNYLEKMSEENSRAFF